MRVAIYSRVFAPSTGGLERFGETLGRWLVRNGHEVTVITSTPGDEAAEDLRIVRRASFDRVARVLRSADVVHVSGLSAKGIGLAMGVRRRPIVTHHGFQAVCPAGLAWSPSGTCSAGPSRGPCAVCPGRGLRGTLDVSVHRAAAERCRSVFVSDALRRRVGLPGSRIYNPVAIHDATGERPGDGERPTVAFAGRLVREKGLDVLLRALRSLPDVHLNVAGEGPLRAEWERLADHLGVASRTTFLGACSATEVTDLYARSTVVCVPSVWAEPFGYAAAEAMAAGRAVVGMPTGALPELLSDGRGLLADGVSPEALAASLRTGLEDPTLRRRTGSAARAFAEREFAVDEVGARYVRLYEGSGA